MYQCLISFLSVLLSKGRAERCAPRHYHFCVTFQLEPLCAKSKRNLLDPGTVSSEIKSLTIKYSFMPYLNISSLRVYGRASSAS
jgi:hypothetical protein